MLNKQAVMKMAEDAGFTWLTTKDYGDELVKFADLILRAEREECAKLCELHAKEPQIMRITKITDNPFSGYALDCAELIRMRIYNE